MAPNVTGVKNRPLLPVWTTEAYNAPETSKILAMDALLAKVAAAHAKETAARQELIEAMRLARAQGASLRTIGRAAGLSHTHVDALTRDVRPKR